MRLSDITLDTPFGLDVLDEIDKAERCDHLWEHHGRCYWCGEIQPMEVFL